MAKKSVDIVIPVYNEEKNIRNLIKIIEKQTIFRDINNIWIISDDSTDKSHEIVKDLSKKIKKINLVIKKERKGKFDSLNKGFNLSNADILIMLDADIGIDQNDALEELIKPFNEDKTIGLTALKTKPMPTKKTFASIASLFSIYLRYEIIKSQKNYKYNNFQTLCGRANAMSKKLYKHAEILNDPGDDQHLFFLTLKNNFRTFYVESATVSYKVPLTIKDYIKQNIRYHKGLRAKSSYYNKNTVKKYSKPNITYFFGFVKAFVKHPISGIFWMPLFTLGYFSTLRDKKFNTGAWEVSETTK